MPTEFTEIEQARASYESLIDLCDNDELINPLLFFSFSTFYLTPFSILRIA